MFHLVVFTLKEASPRDGSRDRYDTGAVIRWVHSQGLYISIWEGDGPRVISEDLVQLFKERRWLLLVRPGEFPPLKLDLIQSKGTNCIIEHTHF